MCHSKMSELCQGPQQAEKKDGLYLISRSYLGVKIYQYAMSPEESYECPEKFNPNNYRVNAIRTGKFFHNFFQVLLSRAWKLCVLGNWWILGSGQMVSQQCLKQGLGLRACPTSRSSAEREVSMEVEVSAVGFAQKIALFSLCQLSFFAKKHPD